VDSTYRKADEREINIKALVVIYKGRHHLGTEDLEARQRPKTQATPLGRQSSRCFEIINKLESVPQA
jgi:hypothetical protein